MHGLNHAVVRQLTFLPINSGGKVFLCPEEASKLTSRQADKIPDSSFSPPLTCHLKLAACYFECP
jgi:hypothetical protein